MPRKALYDVPTVLDLAMDVLLEHGYHGSIMDEIIARTDFNRRGFYLEFGSKQNFLYRVLERYQQEKLAPVLRHLDDNQGLSSIEHFFADYVKLVKGRGCLLINCITELGVDDKQIREMGRHYLDKLQISFIGCLEKAIEHQQVRANVPVESTALQLTCYVQGMAVNAILAGQTDELALATSALLSPLSGR
ncbi:TetR/AcrR family transcriptional regulator [Aliiglaciecola sp. CAU 1673]|uniref:TetR/AcrR family transcriptional regulator n=1 Tax=Aliiglaciecola sp. CAU 1673 TaxID=3032595 RepID=UPI0023DA1A56|nr:TetR/AcrR family transcriptional regulator [Aliiglaciecola sp. CAU 1673]MDF2179292.1 TetR/AcrR family transcriptional regulator [Aliiglaciecola sp. CAU 1673]